MRLTLARLLSAALWAAAAFADDKAAADTALDRYIRKPDPTYSYSVAGEASCNGCTATVIDLKSQTWRKPTEVDRTVWEHWLTIIRPPKVTSSKALLFINGGSNGRPRPDRADPMLQTFAKETGAIVADLRMIPNEPLKFPGEDFTRTEDGIIAYTWDKALRGGDEEWPLRLPMTKAVVRAMDTVTTFAKSEQGGGHAVDRFIVSGGSKRGWTTWTTAAVDKRVIAIAPLVIDMLNVEKSFQHHWRVYGFWAPAVGDYQKLHLMDWMGSPENQALMRVVEPWAYRDRIAVPKYIVNASGDQFFVPDSSQFYFDQLPGEKLLRYVPNADHSLRNSDAPTSLLAWLDSIVHDRPRPKYSWAIDGGRIRVKAETKPTEVRLWQANNPEKRDFRLETIGPAYTSTVLQPDDSGDYSAALPKPEKGWTAYFVELTYSDGRKVPLKVTTGVRVMPDEYPFPPPKLVPPR
ncbi:MAG: PhoPQ-activated pathogenicity-related family protein [Bryobacteraceae bacterium]